LSQKYLQNTHFNSYFCEGLVTCAAALCLLVLMASFSFANGKTVEIKNNAITSEESKAEARTSLHLKCSQGVGLLFRGNFAYENLVDIYGGVEISIALSQKPESLTPHSTTHVVVDEPIRWHGDSKMQKDPYWEKRAESAELTASSSELPDFSSQDGSTSHSPAVIVSEKNVRCGFEYKDLNPSVIQFDLGDKLVLPRGCANANQRESRQSTISFSLGQKTEAHVLAEDLLESTLDLFSSYKKSLMGRLSRLFGDEISKFPNEVPVVFVEWLTTEMGDPEGTDYEIFKGRDVMEPSVERTIGPMLSLAKGIRIYQSVFSLQHCQLRANQDHERAK